MPRQVSSTLTAPSSTTTDATSVLLLGMVFAHSAMEPKRGQEFRDRVRCESVNKLGYQVYSLDDKHHDADILEHCDANFADPRRMIKKMKLKWTDDIQFQHIILDYFFSPVGWARTRWTKRFFYKTIPAFVQENILTTGGKLWLPHLDCITKEIEEYSEIIQAYYQVTLVDNCQENPLYVATEHVNEELLRCPDNLTNETQMQPLYNHSKYPFVCLTVKDIATVKGSSGGLLERLPWQLPQQKILKSIPSIPYDSTPTSSPVKRRRRTTAKEEIVTSSNSGTTDDDAATTSSDDLLLSAPLKYKRVASTKVTETKKQPLNAKRKRTV